MTQSLRITDKPRPRSGYLTTLCWLIALVWTAALPGISGAQTHPFRNVLAPPSIFASLPGGNAGANLDGPLSATVSGAPDVNSESTIKGPVWGWSIQTVQFRAKDTDAWAPATAYHTEQIIQLDTSKPDADLKACLKRAGQWKFTLKVTVDYSDTSNGDTWHGENTADVTTGVSLNATILVRRSGSSAAFSSTASVAAGGAASDEHCADIRLVINPAVGGVLVETPPTLTNGVGIEKNAACQWTPKVTADDGSVEEDRTFSSSDLRGGSVGVQCYGGGASINQRWDEDSSQDGSGPSSWQYSPYFDYDTPEPVVFSPQFVDGTETVAIHQHQMTFMVTEVGATVWDETAADGQGDFAPVTLTGTDAAPFAQFNPPSTGETGTSGSYMTNLVVPDPMNDGQTDIIDIEYVLFDAQDDGVYDVP